MRHRTGNAGSRLRAVFLFVMTAMALGLFSSAANAQALDRLQGELERTERVLAQARNVVEGHGNPRALKQLQFAIRLQAQATQLAHTRPVRQANLLRSLELTRRARELGHRALTIAGQQAQLEQRAQQAMEQLQRLLEFGYERLGDTPSVRIRQLLQIANQRLERAREAFHDQRFEEARTMALETRRMLETVVRETRGRGLERQFDGVRQLIDKAKDSAAESDNEEAHTLLERAEKQFRLAHASAESGNPRAAQHLLTQARQLARRALQMLESPPDSARVQAMLDKAATFVDEMARQVRELDNPEAIRMIENALRHLQKAKDLRAKGRMKQAVAEARVAQNLARRAAQIAGLTLF